MSNLDGPRSACNMLNSVVDDLGDPLVEMIKASSMSDTEKDLMRKQIEELLTNVFMGEKLSAVRSYIHRPTMTS